LAQEIIYLQYFLLLEVCGQQIKIEVAFFIFGMLKSLKD